MDVSNVQRRSFALANLWNHVTGNPHYFSKFSDVISYHSNTCINYKKEIKNS